MLASKRWPNGFADHKGDCKIDKVATVRPPKTQWTYGKHNTQAKTQIKQQTSWQYQRQNVEENNLELITDNIGDIAT